MKGLLVPILIVLVVIAFMDRYEKKSMCESACKDLGYAEFILSNESREPASSCICVDPDKPSEKIKLFLGESGG